MATAADRGPGTSNDDDVTHTCRYRVQRSFVPLKIHKYRSVLSKYQMTRRPSILRQVNALVSDSTQFGGVPHHCIKSVDDTLTPLVASTRTS